MCKFYVALWCLVPDAQSVAHWHRLCKLQTGWLNSELASCETEVSVSSSENGINAIAFTQSGKLNELIQENLPAGPGFSTHPVIAPTHHPF